MYMGMGVDMDLNADKLKEVQEFLKEVLIFSKGGSTYKSFDEMAMQAFIILAIEELNVRINTLESIKHMLNKEQKIDINNMILEYTGIKAKLYGQVKQ